MSKQCSNGLACSCTPDLELNREVRGARDSRISVVRRSSSLVSESVPGRCPLKSFLILDASIKVCLSCSGSINRFEDFEQLLRRSLRTYFCPVPLRDRTPVHAPKLEKTVVPRESCGEDLEVHHRIVRSFARAGFRPCMHAAKENLGGRAREGPGDRKRVSDSFETNRAPRGSTGSA
jgi:hypothetical protein